MQPNPSARSAILAVVITLIFFTSLELYLRHKGAVADYDDGPELWSHWRTKVYGPVNKTTVFIGSSRMEYDLDVDTWQALTHTDAIQLSMVASSPRHFLTDLANDPKFKGRLVVDVTEVLFFSNRGDDYPDQFISYYHKRTPAQRVSFLLDEPVEPRLAFLNEGHYALNALLGELHVSDRPGVYPFLDFPPGFDDVLFNRQNKMTPAFVADTNQHNQVKAIWALLRNDPTPPMSGKDLDSVMMSVKSDVAKIKARGGDVIFTRTPSSGFFMMAEHHMYPRANYFDRLLKETGCKGIYYGDYPATAHMQCPEFSHLSPADAITYTKTLVGALQKETNWNLNAAN